MNLSGRWAMALLAGLVLSVCLNLFVGGMLLGQHLATPHPSGRGPIIARLTEGLPDEARAAIRAELRQHGPQLEAQLRAVRSARREMVALVRAPEIDRATLEASLARLRERSGAVEAIFHEAFVNAVTQLPPEVRARWQPHMRVARTEDRR